MGDTSTKLFDLTFDPKLGSVRFALAEWADTMKDLSPAFRDIVRLFRSHEKRHLESEGATTGDRFASLSGEGYGKWKKAAYPDSRILERDGVLYRALVSGGPGSIEEITPHRMRVGVDPQGYVIQRTVSSWGPTKGELVGREYYLGKAALAHAQGSGPAYKLGKNRKPRPPVRFDGNVADRGAFGYAVQQILQAHIVRARKEDPVLKKALMDKYGGIPAGGGSQKTIDATINKQWK